MGLSSSGSVAFTPPKSPVPALPPQLRSALVEEIDAIAVQPPQTQQLIEEEQFVSPASPDAPTDATSYLDDGFVFGLDGSGLERPKGKVVSLVYEGDDTETTPMQLGMVSATFAGQALFAANGIHTLFDQTDGNLVVTALVSIATIVSSWLAADFGSGVLHWSVDNYGNGKTPIMGGIIAAFQGHHSAPWTICERDFENNVHKLCIPFGIQTVLAMKFVFGLGPAATLFWSVFCVMEIMSQEFHKMSHASKADAGPIWNGLQDMGVSIDRKPHAQHHIAPYDGNYCIVHGLCNKKLDDSGFFRRLEHIVYKLNGIESNSWKLDAKLRARTLRGDYRLPGSH